ncbi:helix-turn-helix domain-containing protein [Limosilactobacillus reuteri]|uniref:helix-turn-helix domain-containing protein n=1 Tax=Limosilactobacillus reuteri TaxID=1598 RepID=UPI00128BDD73|nr:helix-turn-helix domain-containing protein [Limosilactobacillus reuteri]MBM6812978.1 helix-turn-helix domain-containing protein [Limosilactobacillus reuteri]MQB69398.1 hypothetical protein [Limosilactobacillus reuteri]MQC01503.1 hypothetical protein [Limosilactobacillus reuteri]MQC04745.1 hypothetical protein [Limosilactobacillus reuteri]
MTNNICNLKELSKELNCSQNHVYKLIHQGMPYHQIDEQSRRYFILDEVINWLRKTGLKQESVWR